MTKPLRLTVQYNVTGIKGLKSYQQVLKQIARYDGKTFRLIKEEVAQPKGRKRVAPSGKPPSLILSKEEFLASQIPALQMMDRGLQAFADRIFGGRPTPTRGTAMYGAYRVAQRQRAEVYAKYMHLYTHPSKMLNRSEAQLVYMKRVGLMKDDGMFGSYMNDLLTDI